MISSVIFKRQKQKQKMGWNLVKVGDIGEASGKHPGGIWEASKRNLGSIRGSIKEEASWRSHPGGIWETSGTHQGGIWETSGTHQGGIFKYKYIYIYGDVKKPCVASPGHNYLKARVCHTPPAGVPTGSCGCVVECGLPLIPIPME